MLVYYIYYTTNSLRSFGLFKSSTNFLLTFLCNNIFQRLKENTKNKRQDYIFYLKNYNSKKQVLGGYILLIS